MPPRPDFVDQAHRDPSLGRLRPRTGAPVRPVEPGSVRLRTRWEKADEIAALVIAFFGASFIFAHLLVAAGVGLTCR